LEWNGVAFERLKYFVDSRNDSSANIFSQTECGSRSVTVLLQTIFAAGPGTWMFGSKVKKFGDEEVASR